MTDIPPLQPLPANTPIVDSEGRPTLAFIRYMQQQVSGGLQGLVPASRQILAGNGLGGGGDLEQDVTLSLDAVLDDLNDVDLSTAPTNNQVLTFDDTDEMWKAKDATGGGGSGGEAAWIVQAVGTGAPQAINIPDNSPPLEQVGVFINGVRFLTTEYSIVGTVLTVASNAAGDKIEVIGPIGASGGTPFIVTATGTGAAQNVVLPYTGLMPVAVLVFVDGLRWPISDYSISGVNLTLTTNAAGDKIEVIGPLGFVTSGGGSTSAANKIQSAYGRGYGSATANFPIATTSGNFLIAIGTGFSSAKTINAGWVALGSFSDVGNQSANLWVKIADGTETSVTTSGSDNQQIAAYEFAGVANIAVSSHGAVAPDSTNHFSLLHTGTSGYLLCAGEHDNTVLFTGDPATTGTFVEQYLAPNPTDGNNHCGWFGVYKPSGIAFRSIGSGDGTTVQTIIVAVT